MSEDYQNELKYVEKWTKFLSDPTIHSQTIFNENSQIIGSVEKYEMNGEPQIMYWIHKPYWNKGIAKLALKMFLELETARPLYGSTAFDNSASQKVLASVGFKKIDSTMAFSNVRKMEIEEVIFALE